MNVDTEQHRILNIQSSTFYKHVPLSNFKRVSAFSHCCFLTYEKWTTKTSKIPELSVRTFAWIITRLFVSGPCWYGTTFLLAVTIGYLLRIPIPNQKGIKQKKIILNKFEKQIFYLYLIIYCKYTLIQLHDICIIFLFHEPNNVHTTCTYHLTF